MPRFLIEADHEGTARACANSAKVFVASGSHYLTQAEFGCKDGLHRAWVVVEAKDKAEARGLLPPVYRAQARVHGLNRWSLEEIDELLRSHPG